MSDDIAEQIAELASSKGKTIATAESLTGGMLTARLAAAPNASAWFRGGVVAYSADVKEKVLGVPHGPVVSDPTASAMAIGVAKLLDADLGISTTGVGGPGEEEGRAPGTVYIALSWEGLRVGVWEYKFEGDPPEICRQTCDAALQHVWERLRPG